MDSKKLVSQLIQHHFWILLVVLLLTALIVSSIGVGHLRREFQAQRQRINASFASLVDYRVGPKPNADFAKRVREVDDSLRTNVLEAWDVLYTRQREALQWPEIVKRIGDLPPGAEIESVLRESYRDSGVGPEIRRIIDKVNYRRPSAAPAVAMPMVDPDDPDAEPAAPVPQFDGLVVWEKAARDALINRYSPPRLPSSKWVRLTQEDLWVFESLIDVINEMNRDSTDPGNAVIKKIDYLDLAQYAQRDASNNPGDVSVSTGTTPARTTAQPFSVPPGVPDVDDRLMDGRYLNEKMEPVPVNAPQPFAEFRQMFVQMKFLMDQRKVPELLAVCANSPLLIEVRQVRMTMPDTEKPPGSFASGAVGSENRVEAGPFDAQVEVRAIIYLYNPPDRENLGTGSADNPAQRTFGIPVVQ
jgi:hypothetical protein